MNTKLRTIVKGIAAATAALVLAACATAPTPPEGSAAARARLSELQANSALARHAPVEIRDAELAVAAAERTQTDAALGRHLVLMADSEVSIATAWAQARQYEDQRADLERAAEDARLASRTEEADQAREDTAAARSAAMVSENQAQRARNDASTARTQADRARTDAAAARVDTNIARDQTAAARRDTDVARGQTAAALQEAEELQRQLTELEALSTDRGLVVTLGDVLFETGESSLKGGTTADLDTLAGFLNRYADRTVLIEGHTDSIGSDSSNLNLSQRRADAVLAYLVSRDVVSSRLSAFGMGEANPVASNDAGTGRQQNRRVEVIISNMAQ